MKPSGSTRAANNFRSRESITAGLSPLDCVGRRTEKNKSQQECSEGPLESAGLFYPQENQKITVFDIQETYEIDPLPSVAGSQPSHHWAESGQESAIGCCC